MSQLDGVNLNEKQKGPKNIRMVIIAIIAVVIFIVLLIISGARIKNTLPEEHVDEIVTDEPVIGDGLFTSRSTWQNGNWCLVDKESVKTITIEEDYSGQANRAWGLDGVIMYYDEEKQAVHVAVGNGIHMLGNMSKAFADFPNATSITGLELLETSNVTDMSYLFANSGFENIDISMWNTKNVSTFAHMFSNTTNIKEVNLSNLDMSNAVDLSYMFAESSGMQKIYFENVDTSNAKLMSYFLYNTGSGSMVGECFFYGDLETSQIVDFEGFFKRTYLTNMQDVVNSLDTQNAENMARMFEDAVRVKSLDLTHFNVSKVKNMDFMFRETNRLAEVKMDGWNATNLESAEEMFKGCYNYRHFTGLGSTPKLTNTTKMFADCFELITIDLTCLDGVTLESAYRMFYGCEHTTDIFSNGFTVATPTEEMFEYCLALPGFDEEQTSSDMLQKGYLTAK